MKLLKLFLAFLLPLSAFAARETGHSDLQRLMRIYGFNQAMAEHLATSNVAVDNIAILKAIGLPPFAGMASEKLHFEKVVTGTDLDEKDLAKILTHKDQRRSYFAAIAAMFKSDAIGGGVASLSNAEAAELIARAIEKGDGDLFGAGLHTLMDVGSLFHVGYLGAMSVPLPLLEKFLKAPFGHLVDGVSSDNLTIAKMVLAMEAAGPFLITLRDSQPNGAGVDHEWLEKLKSQGVDVKDNASIMKWFYSQPEVKAVLEADLPANKGQDFLTKMADELKATLKQYKFVTDEAYLDRKMAQMLDKAQTLRASSDESWTANTLVYELIEEIWNEKMFNEPQVIKETVTDYLGLEKYGKDLTLDNLVLQPDYHKLPDYVQAAVTAELKASGTKHPHTKEWIIEEIAAKVTRGILHHAWQKFNTSYLNEGTQEVAVEAEKRALDKIEESLFGIKGKYVDNPKLAYLMARGKIFANWKQRNGLPFLRRVMAVCDAILTTKVAPGYRVHTLTGSTLTSVGQKWRILGKTLAFVWKEAFVSPMTSPGNFAVKKPELRELVIAEIKEKFPNGIIPPEALMRTAEYNEYINLKYNSDVPTGPVQKAAVAVKSAASWMDGFITKTKVRANSVSCKKAPSRTAQERFNEVMSRAYL